MANATYTTNKSDSSSYEDGYKIFLSRSDFREKVLAKYDELIQDKVKGLSKLRVLDIGCGNGTMTKKYLSALKKISKDIELNLSEPATKSLDDAMELLKEEAPRIYSPQNNLTFQFNHIIASYVFYHLSPDELTTLTADLITGGSLAIMMGTSDHPLKSHPDLKALSAHGSSDDLTPFLKQLSERDSFEITRHKIDTFIDIKNLWQNGSFSPEAKTMLSFSLNKNFDELPIKAKDALNEIFYQSIAVSDGKLKSVHEIIWIERKK